MAINTRVAVNSSDTTDTTDPNRPDDCECWDPDQRLLCSACAIAGFDEPHPDPNTTTETDVTDDVVTDTREPPALTDRQFRAITDVLRVDPEADGVWMVTSESTGDDGDHKQYRVARINGDYVCECADYTYNVEHSDDDRCKHGHAAAMGVDQPEVVGDA